MELGEFQELALATDQFPHNSADGDAPTKGDTIPLLGLIGEVGSLASEFKKLLRDGEVHSRYKAHIEEDLGDILWYVANVASKAGIELDDVARACLRKARDRFIAPVRRYFYDEDCAPDAQLPRRMRIGFRHVRVDEQLKMQMIDLHDGVETGDPLSDNAYEDDGYRFHDAMHITFATMLGWSPVLRKLLRSRGLLVKRFPDDAMRESAEDGGRPQVVEEAIVNLAYVYYVQHPNATMLDYALLRQIKELTANIEVSSRSEKEWERTLLRGFCVWDELRRHNGGIVEADLYVGSVTFSAAFGEAK